MTFSDEELSQFKKYLAEDCVPYQFTAARIRGLITRLETAEVLGARHAQTHIDKQERLCDDCLAWKEAAAK